jgi:hypothetical protein
MGVSEGVSILQAMSGLKSKAGDGSRSWRGEGDTLAVGTVTVVVDGHWTRPDPLKVGNHTTKVVRLLRFSTPERLYVYDPILQLLAQDLQDVAVEFRKFIQEKNAVVRQRHFARQQYRPMPLFVKNVPYLTMHGHERASVLARDPRDLFYNTGTDQVRSGD